MRTNTAARRDPIFTHEGARAAHINAEAQLRRSVMSCLLWEDEFYESGKTIADRITETANSVRDLNIIADIAIEARSKMHLRHVPLLLLLNLVRRGRGQTGSVADVISMVIQRPDEMGELLSLYWTDKSNKHMVPAQLRKGLSRALAKFNEYSLAKYDSDRAKVKLRDVLRVARPTPKDDAQKELWRRAVKRELETPDTWEVALSGGADKKETFERLIREGNLGYFALLRNLRNMVNAGCDLDLVREAIIKRQNGAHRILPFRYIAAARAAPQLEGALDTALLASIAELPTLPGDTIVLVDVSGSMNWKLSGKSDLKRIDAASALAAIWPGNTHRVFTFSNRLVEVPARKGMAGIDAIVKSQPHVGTELHGAITALNQFKHDRLVVITDEQAHAPVFSLDRRRSGLPDPRATHAYMINVASAQNGVGYGRWTHIDGFSENVIRYIYESEQQSAG